MIKNYLKNLLIFEILIVAAVPFIFKYIEPKRIAALGAGSLFVILGISVLYGSLKYKALRKTFFTVAGCLHLFLVSVPMLAARIYFFDTDFDHIQIMGLDAPDFHKYSEYVYIALLCATIYQFVKQLRQTKKAA